MEYTLNQSAWGRAKQDTLSAFHTLRFWFFELCITAGLTIWVLLWIPPCIYGDWEIVYKILVPVAGVFAGLGIVFLISLFSAPYKQRNEARHNLEKLSQTPLIVECNSYEKCLVGKNWLEENLYLWLLSVILTNQSDTQNVSTKVISLEVHYPVAGGNVKSYTLSLVPNIDKDKYRHPSMGGDKSLGENEYLPPRQSLRGFYQFLDGETTWKPKSIQTWPTLVVVDSFGASHRREFNRPRFAIQSNSDKEGSQA